MPPTIPLLTQLYPTFDGAEIEGLMNDLLRVEVDLSLYLPGMCVLQINDPQFRWVDDARLRLGQEVQIKLRTSENESGSATPVFSGQVTSVEVDMREDLVATLLLRCYDRSHLLQRGTKVRTFVQATDSDIASKIAREHGLQASVDATSQVHTQIFQDNISDYQFLMDRARAVGHVLLVEDRRLYFKKPENLPEGNVTLNYGVTLREFHPRLTVASQVKEVSVRGWDPKTKAALVGQSGSSPFRSVAIGLGKRGSEMSGQAFSTDPGQLLVTDQPVASQAEGDSLAKALLTQAWARDIRADGTAFLDPNIKPGIKLTVSKIGTKFSGKYFVTSVRHVFDAEGHIDTHFNVNGLSAETTADLILEGAAPGQTATGRIAPGVAVGIVTNNKDPENAGRVKVKFPTLTEDLESDWVRLAAPMAGADRGFFFVPEIDDEVVVAFEHGDFNRGYIIGVLWNGKDKPPLTAAEAVGGDGKVNKRIVKSRSGHTITLDDTSGAEKIEIIDKTKKNKIVIDSGPGTLTLETTGDVTVQSTSGNVTVKGTNITIEGKAKVELKAPQIEIAATGKAKVSGPIVELN